MWTTPSQRCGTDHAKCNNHSTSRRASSKGVVCLSAGTKTVAAPFAPRTPSAWPVSVWPTALCGVEERVLSGGREAGSLKVCGSERNSGCGGCQELSAEALTPRTGAPRLHCAACGRRRSIEILDSDLDLCTDGLNVRFAMRGGCNAEMWPKSARSSLGTLHGEESLGEMPRG